MLSCDPNFLYVCMFNVYEDSNFGGFRLPCVYVHVHKWLEHQILGKHRLLPTLAVLRRIVLQ